jgi:hypothetical protein
MIQQLGGLSYLDAFANGFFHRVFLKEDCKDNFICTKIFLGSPPHHSSVSSQIALAMETEKTATLTWFVA